MNNVASLQEEVGKRRPGDKVLVTVRNKGGDVDVKEILLRNKDGETKLVSKEEVKKNAALGATFRELSHIALKTTYLPLKGTAKIRGFKADVQKNVDLILNKM